MLAGAYEFFFRVISIHLGIIFADSCVKVILALANNYIAYFEILYFITSSYFSIGFHRIIRR